MEWHNNTLTKPLPGAQEPPVHPDPSRTGMTELTPPGMSSIYDSSHEYGRAAGLSSDAFVQRRGAACQMIRFHVQAEGNGSTARVEKGTGADSTIGVGVTDGQPQRGEPVKEVANSLYPWLSRRSSRWQRPTKVRGASTREFGMPTSYTALTTQTNAEIGSSLECQFRQGT